MNKQYKFIILMGSVFLILFCLLLYVLINSSAKQTSIQSPINAIPTQISYPTNPSFHNTSITLNGVTLKTIYNNVKDTDSKGDVVFDETPNYQFVYFPRFKNFTILVLGSPFAGQRIDAENQFVSYLQITKQQACLLQVDVSTPFFANPNEAGVSYPLSFCQK